MSSIRATATILVPSLLCALLVLVGCASMDQKFGDEQWYQKSKQASGQAVEATREAASKAADATKTTAAKAYERMQHYLAEKDVLQTFHDAGEHSETAVLAVLHKSGAGGHAAGTGTQATTAAPGTSTPGAPAAAGAPKPRKPPASPPSVPAPGLPEEYAGIYRWPLDAGIISSEYGERWGKMHKGLDLAADAGEPVYAIAAGEVIYAGDGLRGYGNVVIMRHDRRYSSLYAHNSELKVKQGDHVEQGTLIALLGNTGHSTGPHVHFEIRDGDAAINPHTLLPKGNLAYAVCNDSACEAAAARGMVAARGPGRD
jgi:murein DD-endopeptidase MepM/ murein hydrolase activator NlpD